MNLRNNSGLTLASLSIYIIVSVVVLSSLAFLNVNYIAQIAELSTNSQESNEILKAESYLISDIKSASRVLEYSKDHLRLDNGVQYNIVYRAEETSSTENQFYNIYELYRNDILVTDKMTNLEFDYGYEYNSTTKQNDVEWVIFKALNLDLRGNEQYIRVGKGY